MKRLVLLAVLAGCSAAPPSTAPRPVASEATLRRSLDSLFADTAFAHAHWGVHVRSLDRGDTLFRLNATKNFVPASNMKLLTGAGALQVLGPDHRYRTVVAASGPVRDGVLRGDLVVSGSGDPTLSARFHAGDTRAAFRGWADSLRAHGVRRIAGRVIGDDDVFDDIPLGRGWAWDDLEAYYAAEISALELNEGVVEVRVRPGGRAGDPGVVTLDPATAYTPVENRTVTVGSGAARLEVRRAPRGPGLVASGTVPRDTAFLEETVAVRNPTLFFATVLRETLEEAGIRVDGAAADIDDLPLAERSTPATPLFAHVSPPLREILPAYLKPSQNQIAEILFRTLGSEERGEGSADAGEAVLDSVFAAWNLPSGHLVIADGSGLSRYNRVSPDFLAALLAHMDSTPHAALWRDALPVAGVDGTLANRMRGTPAAGNVRAKTGTLNGVRALSGYLTTADGERLIFSMLVNQHTLSARDADRVIDAALLRLVEWRRDAPR